MTEQDLIHKIEWVNKRCSLKGEPLTQSQIELLKFVFADTVVNKNFALADVIKSLPTFSDIEDICDEKKEMFENGLNEKLGEIKEMYIKGRISGFKDGAKWYANKVGNVL